MISSLPRNWWLAALSGVLAIILGIVAFMSPGVTFGALVLLFGAYMFGAYKFRLTNQETGAAEVQRSAVVTVDLAG